MTNPAAQAWIDAREQLGIRYIHPFTYRTNGGQEYITTGGLLPDFGSPQGTLLLTRFDRETMDGTEEDTEFYSSGLNPKTYEPFNREVYVETLNDWGWYGDGPPPAWFFGGIRQHGGRS